MDNSKQSKSVLCFVDGEPHLYNKELKEYIKLELDYDATLNSLKKELSHITKRPKMKEIWQTLAKIIDQSANYCHNYNKQTGNKDLSNSFENKMTRDISSFLDLKFARMTEAEKQARAEELKELKKHKQSIHAGICTMYQISCIIKKN